MSETSGISRRKFVRLAASAGAGVFIAVKAGGVRKLIALPLPGGTLDPTTVPKYVTPLLVPPAMPRVRTFPMGRRGKKGDYYDISVRQFNQQILPTGLPQTTVWGYGSRIHKGTHHYPSFTIEATTDRPVRVKWSNELVDQGNRFLPHLLPVDPTLHWANPPGGTAGRDMRPTFTETPGPYTGPVPMVTHVHGAHTNEESDGYAEAWFLPHAVNIPAGYAKVGSWYDRFKSKARSRFHVYWTPGSAIFTYPNTQRPATLWYHDHTLGMTRTNVYAGPAGFYHVRGGPQDLSGGVLPGPAPKRGDAPGIAYHEIPIAIQDRCFNQDGSLFYPGTREFFDGFTGPYIPQSDVPPIWNPEFFANVMVVNGNSWPSLTVEPRRYRFRFLDGCDARFLILKIVSDPLARPGTSALPFWQIGAEGGFLPEPVSRESLLMSPAERADCIVDFTGLAEGTELYLINEGPDEPFGGGEPGLDFDFADVTSTGQVMKFVVGELKSVDTSTPPAELTLPARTPLPDPVVTRKVSLNEVASTVTDGPVEALLGSMDGADPVQMGWMDPVSETPKKGDTEIWEIYNFTADAHPIHIHEVMFEVVDRQPLVTDANGISVAPAQFAGDAIGPEAWERGTKDTVIAYPGQVTRVKATFDLAGRYSWHCHIVEHEDNEMMRPYQVIL